ncbi:hypothetical protein GW17_00004963 [Ensete ventricosum]|nr:hypothetical protein GW17_00004963 [Ensete ventricosum]RZR93275.1 hypothetical protein BHM03_00021739 [Ensete ventricosum]
MSDDSPTAPAPPADGSSHPEDDLRTLPPDPSPPAEPSPRKTRFPRACNTRPSAAARPPLPERRPVTRREKEERQKAGRVITSLVQPPPPSQLLRWELRSMWELAAVLDFFHVSASCRKGSFRPLLNIAVEFSAEELETALITPNSTLDDVHMPLLKVRSFLIDGHDTRFQNRALVKLLMGRYRLLHPMGKFSNYMQAQVLKAYSPDTILNVNFFRTEIETYKTLDPRTRILILKALCDIRVEVPYYVSMLYEDDPIIGHRLYREIRQVEVKKVKGKGSSSVPLISIQWEAVATNLDEFREVSVSFSIVVAANFICNLAI